MPPVPPHSSTLTQEAPALGQLLRNELVLRWTDDTGQHRQLLSEPAVIGSAEGAAVRVQAPTVSRVHAELVWRSEVPWVRDLGSHNGTRVGGVRVDAALLEPGARLTLGSTVLEVEHVAEPSRVLLWPDAHFGQLRGESPVMRELFARLSSVSRTESTVLITGETGTGKELAARAIHEESSRAGGPFITVDCTAVPEGLFEAELFGHAKGAFTGANAAREGAMEAASGGTLFLDEIGELPAAMQPKLLRALEQRTVRRVGESAHRPVDVRFVAATHQDLAGQVGQGLFREDLFFRLAVIVVEMPSLRARREDIPLLARHFAARDAGPQPQGAEALSDELLLWMAAQPWRGNVRELRNFLERTRALGADVARAQTSSLVRRALPELPLPDIDRTYKEVRDEWTDHLEREYLRGWLERTDGNVSAAAEAMGVNRTYAHRLLKKHGLAR
ncbi:MAG: sigma 54-interacting transcriptional regulator [Myxococcales bacterium]|nr:sigma 54-interacting transcriptional regulator [Myxococcales bacterium]